MVDYKELEVGHEFTSIGYEMTSSIVSKYEKAVEAYSPVANIVPPLAIAAYTMQAMSLSFPLPLGSVHASQELEFFKPVTVGSHIDCHAQIIQKTNRAKLTVMVIGLDTFDQDKEKVLSGKATVILTNPV